MIFPLLPIFLTTVLGAGAIELGMIEGVSETAASFCKLWAGALSDRLKRKKVFVGLGYGVSSLMRSLIGLAPSWPFVLGLRFLDRVGKGIRTAPRDAMIAQSVATGDRGRAFGFHRMMDHAGAVIGSLSAAGLVFLMPGQYRTIFLLAAVPAIIACLLLFKVREIPPISEIVREQGGANLKTLPKRIMVFLFFVFIFNLGNASDAFLLLRLKESGVAVVWLPLLWAFFHVIKALSNQGLGLLSDRGSRLLYVILGWFLYALIYFIFSLKLSQAWIIFLFLIYGGFFGLTESPEKALLADWSRHDRYGSIFGAYHFTLGVSLLPANLLFGYLWQQLGFALAFQMATALTFAATIGMLIWWMISSPSTH